ncbi:MAG: RDD family protein [Bacteroidota bacterium]
MAVKEEGYQIQEIITPENITLNFFLPSKLTNFAAFYVDFAILNFLFLFTFLLSLFFLLPNGNIKFSDFDAVFILIFFLLHMFYFIFFEIYWQGSTPGKSFFNLRVVNREGLPLTVKALVIRNLIREVELFIPIGTITLGVWFMKGDQFYLLLVSCLWLFALMIFPLLNQEGRRLGDFIAGTVVVYVPKVRMQGDLIESRAEHVAKGGALQVDSIQEEDMQTHSTGFSLSRGQLTYYGIKELQILEEILRKTKNQNSEAIKKEVAKRIQKRIGWLREESDYEKFLEEFYKAQRAYLEGRIIFGERKGDKYDDLH